MNKHWTKILYFIGVFAAANLLSALSTLSMYTECIILYAVIIAFSLICNLHTMYRNKNIEGIMRWVVNRHRDV